MSSKTEISFSIASHDIHERVSHRFLYYVIGSKCVFGKNVGDKIKIAKLLYNTTNEMAIVECRIVVENDMIDHAQNLHSGCIAYLLDMITALPFVLLGCVCDDDVPSKKSKFAMASFAPSQSLNVIYSGKASLGSRLKIVAETVTNVKSTLYVRGEIWEIDGNSLVAFANHVKVMPRKPPLAALELGFKL